NRETIRDRLEHFAGIDLRSDRWQHDTLENGVGIRAGIGREHQLQPVGEVIVAGLILVKRERRGYGPSRVARLRMPLERNSEIVELARHAQQLRQWPSEIDLVEGADRLHVPIDKRHASLVFRNAAVAGAGCADVEERRDESDREWENARIDERALRIFECC